MVVQRKLIITESERDRIRGLYTPKKQKEYVFDFVLTENEKYLIITDQVFVAGGDGKSIGSIWENTHIFNEIIQESINKLGNTISESVHNELNNIVEITKWTKENITEWVNDSNVITESIWDTIKTGGMEWIFKEGVLPFLRWIRRGLATGIGMVIDVVVSILAVKSNAVIWFIICGLDIYEIATNDFDPKDPERKENPYTGLIGDIVSALLTGAAGFTFKKSVSVLTKTGAKKATPSIIRMLQWLVKKVPSLRGSIKNAISIVGKKFKGDGIISTILRSIDKILDNLMIFINKLLSKQGIKATAMGVGSVAVIKNTIDPEMGWTGRNKPIKVTSNGINPDIMADAERLGVLK
jgi:hypothetical protein